MNNGLITQEQARSKLRSLCKEAGGVGKLAEKLGLTISAVSHQLNGHRPIQGKVAEFMGLESVRISEVHYKEVSNEEASD